MKNPTSVLVLPLLLFSSSKGADAAAGSELFRPIITTTASDAKRRRRAAAFPVVLRSQSRPERHNNDLNPLPTLAKSSPRPYSPAAAAAADRTVPASV